MAETPKATQRELEFWVQCYTAALAGSAHEVATANKSADRTARAAAEVADAALALVRERHPKGKSGGVFIA